MAMSFFQYIHNKYWTFHYFHSFNRKIYFGRNVNVEGNVKLANYITLDDNVEVRNKTKEMSYIGSYTSINRNSVLRGKFSIGEYCAIAPNCSIIGVNHGFSDLEAPIKKQPVTSKGGIVVENNVWVGANCVVLDGVTIGEGSVIGAGSIVTKSIPPYSIAVGNPCKVIKSRK